METNITLATKARQVETWLETLPLADAPAAARALAAYLAAHDRGDVPLALRRQLFDLVLTPVWRCFADLEAGLGDPARLDLALNLLKAAARFASRVAQEFGVGPAPRFGADPFPAVADRFLRLVRELACLCHGRHLAMPSGFWLDVHAIGHWLFLAGREADGPLQALYRNLLLEAAVDPYRLSAREYLQARDIILRHGHLARVEAVEADDSGSGGSVFGVRLAEDRPLHLLAWERDGLPGSDLTLNTTALVRHLAHLLSHSGQAGTRQADGLHRLKQAWGGSAQRMTARRRPAGASRCRATLGFMPVHRHLAEPHGPADAAVQWPCELIDESLRGLALSAASRPEGFGVGSLVGIRRDPADACDAVGLVRWFKTDPAGGLRFGVKLLHGRVQAGCWGYPGADCTHPALLAGPNGAMRQLVLPDPEVDAHASLEIRRGDARTRVRLAGRIDGSGEVAVFRCAD
jgi:hypothetical protein